jgi:hypothetical protein
VSRSVAVAALTGLLLAAAPPRAAAVEGRVAAPAASRRDRRRGTEPATAREWQTLRGKYFQRTWGVDLVGVRRVASGFMLRLDYRVVDPVKAAALTARSAHPLLVDERTRTALSVPAMENVGELRQVGAAEPYRTYYMIFGNPGGLVKRGGHVTLAVGNLRAEGIVVE